MAYRVWFTKKCSTCGATHYVRIKETTDINFLSKPRSQESYAAPCGHINEIELTHDQDLIDVSSEKPAREAD